METAVLSELVRTLTHRGLDPRVYCWRTMAGSGSGLRGRDRREARADRGKAVRDAAPGHGRPIKNFQSDMAGAAMPGYVVHPGDLHLPLGPQVTALPFADL